MAIEVSANAQSPAKMSPPKTNDLEASFRKTDTWVWASNVCGTLLPKVATMRPLKHITTLVTESLSV